MKRFLRWVWSFLEFLIIIYVIILTSFLLCKNKYGYTQFGNYTFVNVDLIGEKNIQDAKSGDLLVVKNSNDIKEGDVIYYYAVYNETYIIRSSAVMGVKNDDYSYLYTVDDSGPTSIVGTRVLGKYANTYSNLGSILSVLESRLGFLFLVLLPILIVFIYQVYEFVVIIRYERVGNLDLDDSSAADKKESLKDVSSTKEKVNDDAPAEDEDNKEDDTSHEVDKAEIKDSVADKQEDDVEIL